MLGPMSQAAAHSTALKPARLHARCMQACPHHKLACQRPVSSLIRRQHPMIARADDSSSGSTSTTTAVDSSKLFGRLGDAYENYRKAPPSMKFDYSKDVLDAMTALSAGGAAPKWGAAAGAGALKRRNVFQGELRQVGIKSPDKIAVASIRNDATFLFSVVAVTSVLAVVAGQLPGDWGFFSAYLIGGISLAVLAVGSTAPGLLSFFIDKFSQVFPDYRGRVVRHEAGHFLLGYLVGVPITGYSLELGREHTEFAEAKMQARLIERMLSDEEIDALAQVAVAGVAAEGQEYEEIMGQTADLFDLQRILLRSKNKLSDQQQQNITRWAVFSAASLLRKYKKEHTALMEAMARGAPMLECVQAIERA